MDRQNLALTLSVISRYDSLVQQTLLPDSLDARLLPD